MKKKYKSDQRVSIMTDFESMGNASKTVLLLSVFALLAVVFTACSVVKPYQRPNVVDEKYYRTDQIVADTAGIANMSWKELFTDDLLQGYVQKALDNNLDIRMAIEQIKVAESYMKQGKASFFPTMSVGPQLSFQSGSVNTQFGRIAGNRQEVVQYQIGADLSWEADIWGKIRSNQKALLASFLRTEAAHQGVKSLLVATIADSYYQLLALDEQKRITETTIDTRKKNLETTKALKEAGTLTEVAVKQSEALLYNAQGILLTIDNSIKLLENFFSILLGVSPQSVPRNTLDIQQITSDLAVGVPAQLLRNRPDVKTAEYQLMNAFELTNVAKANFYPSLRLSASGGVQSVDIDVLFSAGSLFGNLAGSLLQPVLNQRKLRTQYEVSLSNQQSAYLNYRKALLTATREVSDALYSYQTQNKMTEIKLHEFEDYKLAKEYSQDLVNQGFANYLEVLRAEENQLTAQLSYINARYGKLRAMVQLYQALGGGWR